MASQENGSRSKTMHLSLPCLFVVAYGFLQVGSAQNNSCIVTVHAKHTAYNITKMPNVSGLEHCDYSWANASNHVLAHNLAQKLELVIRKNVNTLVILGCMNHTILSLDCVSQGRFTIHCLGYCSEPARRQEDEGPLTETSNPWIPVIVVIVIILMVLCFLFYRYRDDVSRICNDLSNYTPGKRSSVDETIVDVPKIQLF